MITTHPNEIEIQEYALNQSVNQHINEHIKNCTSCKQKVVQYTIIFETIKRQSRPDFGFDLRNLVMQKISKPTEYKEHFTVSDLFSILFLSIGVVSVIIYSYNVFLSKLPFYINSPIGDLFMTGVIVYLLLMCVDAYQKHQKNLEKINLC